MESHEPVVRPPAYPHRVLDAGRRGPDQGRRRQGGRRRPACGRHHRPRQHVRDPGLLQGVQRPGDRARARDRAVHGGRVPARATGPPGAGRRRRRGGRAGREALLPPHGPGRDHPGLPQPDEAVERRLPGGLLLQAAGRLGAARALPRGDHRHHRLPRGRRAPGPPEGRHGAGRGPRRPPPGHLRAGLDVRRAAGPRPARAAPDQPDAARAGPAHRGARCWPPTTATTPTRPTPWPTTPCCACRPVRRWTTRTGSSSTATSTT